MKLVLDTNIWISGLLLPNTQAGKLIQLWLAGTIEIVMSQALLEELAAVLNYPKINKRLNWSAEKIHHYIEFLMFHSEMVVVNTIEIKIPQDPSDEKILATFLQSNADFLISGDKHLLDLAPRYKIISLGDFFNLVAPEF